jgi:zona occludens toxin (predicted ATPase)
MILFISKTWFLWWMFAVAFIVRWFHVVSAPATTEDFNTDASDREQSQTVRAQLEGVSALGRTA